MYTSIKFDGGFERERERDVKIGGSEGWKVFFQGLEVWSCLLLDACLIHSKICWRNFSLSGSFFGFGILKC